MIIKFLAIIPLVLVVSSEIQIFLQNDDIANAQAAAAAIPPKKVPYSNPEIHSANSKKIDQDYQLLTTPYQQVNAIVLGFQSANTDHSNGSINDKDFNNAILSMIPKPFSDDVSGKDINQVYSKFLGVYSRYVSRVSDLLRPLSLLIEQFGKGAIANDKYVAGLNQIYQNNGDLLDYSYLYSFEQFIVNQLQNPVT